MKTKEQILADITGIDIDRLPHDTVRAGDALEAMEIYQGQIKVELLKEFLPEHCLHYDTTEGGRFCTNDNRCRNCIRE